MSEKYCLVLSGGGAKGVYHIGAWKALRELGVELEAVVGNSIGAVIATFVAQDEHEILEDIGSRIGLDYILNVPDELVKNGELSINLKKRSAFREFYKNTISKRGLDTSPLRNLLTTHIDETKVRGSDLDFGIVAYNVTDMKPREVFVEEMEEGELISYAMASSAFPGFEQPEIAGKKYIDGGVHDNMPFAMAKNRGYRNIIVVDISGAGVNKKPDIIGTRTMYIKNSINMGGVLDFDRKFMDDFTRLGYLDTMKTFGRYRGIDYFIEPDEKTERAFLEFLETEDGQAVIMDHPATGGAKKPATTTTDAVRRLLPKKNRYNPNWLPLFADCAAKSVGLERIRTWTYRELIEAVLAEEKVLRAESEVLAEQGTRQVTSRIRKDLRARELMSRPYVYSLLGDRYIPDSLLPSLERFTAEHYPELTSGICFLDMAEGFRVFLEGARV